MTNANHRLEELSDSQRALLALRLRRAKGAQQAPAGIPRRPPELRELPLAFGQEQLWFIDQLAPGLPTYNVPAALRLVGALDRGALARALDAVVERHESLRTSFPSVAGRPLQAIAAPGLGEPALVDLAGLDSDDREAELGRLAQEQAREPFELERGPLIRTRLVRLVEDEHVLLVTVHHIVFDGWSLGVLLRELAALYEAFATDAPPAVPELAVQFADYALWERERLQGEALDRLVDYWRGALEGAPALQLPTDRPRPAVQTYAGGVERLEMGGHLLEQLKALSRREGTTPFVTLLAAVQALLSRYSGQEDIVVGTASANRSRPELAPLIGYLVNTLAIRTDLSGDPTFRELVGVVRTATLEAYAHQDLPFAKLVEALRIERDPSRSPVFQVGFTLEEVGKEEVSAAGLKMWSEGLDTGTSKFDLSLFAEDVAGRLHVRAEFASALFDRATVRRLLGHLRVLLEGAVEDPERRLSQLPVLSERERRRQLAEWNATAAPIPAGCLHERFEAQVARTPEATVAVLGDERLSYAELNGEANQVARRLRGLGVGPGVLVGVCMQRSLRRLAGVLGILKAGGAYVPLDPDYPPERLGFMLEDTGAPVVVTDEASAGSLPASAAAVVSLDGERGAIAALDPANLEPLSAAGDLAYVIYTSGSTGRPKGVLIEHRSAVNFIVGQIERFDLGPGDRILQFASLNFDVSVYDIFAALLSGAALVLSATETLRSPPRLAELIRGEQITLLGAPPAVLGLLSDQQFPDLRVVIAGGEAFSSALVKDWARPGLRFVNGYGPTEATVGAAMCDCGDDGLDPPPIGRPLPNYQAYVLDSHLNPVAVGVAGELHIGGAGLARGYHRRPELTAEKFIPDPFSEDPAARLYKTGDVVHQLPDGNLRFLGRLDDQVKIRGFRVELGEIEAVLTHHPAVQQSAVLLDEDGAGHKQLIAYVTLDPSVPAPTPADLRQDLAERVPPYMVPAHLLILEAFPLTGSGKLDRRALPAPDAAAGVAYMAPGTLVETVLADMFGAILGLERVGVADSFFDLGGNSLQAMQLIARLREELGVDVEVTTIFLAPSVRELAGVLGSEHGLSDESFGDEDDLGELEQLSDEEVAALLASVDDTQEAA